MKKSTLITTIAMIVVVVVALSTATYAWFSSQTTSQATTTVTTVASSDWLLSEGTIKSNDGVTFATAADAINLSASLNQGLYSPVKALTVKPTNNSPTAEVVSGGFDGDTFIECLKYDADTIYCNKVTTQKPTVIRVANGKETSQPLFLTVCVNLGTAASVTDNVKYAAASMTFYIATKDTVYTLGYTPAAATSADYTAHSNTWTAIDGSATYSDADDYADYLVDAGTPVAKANVTGNVPGYETVTTSGDFITASAGTPALNVQTGQMVLVYTISMGSIASGAGINMCIYTWMNGWLADDAATSAEVTVVMAFGAQAETVAS